jgi:very-short-patch-repair endonuclease
MSLRIYNPDFKPFASKLRNDLTLPERILWYQVLNKNKLGIKFKRQVNILDFIVDYYNKQYRIVIELDGNSHDGVIEKDIIRDKILLDNGYIVIRILNHDVLNNIDGINEYLRLRVMEILESYKQL